MTARAAFAAVATLLLSGIAQSQNATPAEIKKAFYKNSRCYHPDRFFQLPDDELKARVNAVYKRLTEAYAVLKEDAKRQKYLADITGPERAQKLRFTEASEADR